jgi:hypothetical protein
MHSSTNSFCPQVCKLNVTKFILSASERLSSQKMNILSKECYVESVLQLRECIFIMHVLGGGQVGEKASYPLS